MNLFNPWNLLWMAPLAGGIVALWMLRLKREDVTVSSLYLWNSLLQETQANAPFQKLRRSLLLFLQLLTAFLLIGALARPFVYGSVLLGHTVILVIDTSASMNATDVGPSRLAAAKDAAAEYVRRDLGSGDVATIITAGNKPASQIGFTGDKGRLLSAIDGIAPTDTVVDMPAALTLAQSLAGGRAGAQIRVFSDGAFPPDDTRKLALLDFGTTDVKFHSIGTTGADNLAITAMDGRRNPATGAYEVFVNVQNLGSHAHSTGTLSLLKDGRLIDARALALTNNAQAETFSSPLLKTGGLVTARLDDVKDDLAVDNQASLVLPPPRPRKVLLVTQGNLFLERGLNVDPDVILEECAPDEFATIGKKGAGYAMVVFDGSLPAEPLPPGNYLVFNAFNAQTPLTGAGSSMDTPNFVDQSRTHPVMRFVDLEGLSLAKSARAASAPWGQVLAEADSGPIIAAGEHGGLRVVSVAFDLSDSNWPLRISFPIFLSNALSWLTAGSGLGAGSPDTPTGGVASLTLPPGQTSATVVRPDGTTTTIAAPSTGGIALYDGTEHAGVYHARVGGADYPFAVNLLSKDESALATQPQTALNHAGASPILRHLSLASRVKNDLWPLVAALALLFLVAEWFVFHRRL